MKVATENKRVRLTDEEKLRNKRLAQAAWRAANKDKISAYNALYQKKFCYGSSGKKSHSADWVEKNKARHRANVDAWQKANKERVKKNRTAWNKANPEKCVSYTNSWRAANPEAASALRKNRRARKKLAYGKMSKDLPSKLFALQKGKCPCCGNALGRNFHVDHIKPLAKGGSNSDDNIQLLHAKCNMQKGAKDPVDFMQSRGFLL